MGQDPFVGLFTGHPPFCAALTKRGAGQDPFVNEPAGHPPFCTTLAGRGAGQGPFACIERERAGRRDGSALMARRRARRFLAAIGLYRSNLLVGRGRAGAKRPEG